MPINVDYPELLKLFPQHLAPKRNESASFLIWYLENYYRLDSLEAVDAVCDQKGDKGIDGIFVNDNDQTITVFQSRISQKSTTTIGDTGLKEFVGTLKQFESEDGIRNLIDTGGHAHVVALVKRLDLINKINTHSVRGEFVTNINIDVNGLSYLKTISDVTFVGKDDIIARYISDSRAVPATTEITFDIQGFTATSYVVDADSKAVIAPIKATELIALHGIEDQSLFAYNVRGPLGRTQVNKDIVKSLRDASRHKMFPLFHNGVTIIARTVEVTDEKIRVTGYNVVNGCQSLTALFDNKTNLTDGLRLIAKFIQMDPTSKLAQDITQFSNNQNGVKPRDFKANSSLQIRLKNEFDEAYKGVYRYEIKRGEEEVNGAKISNEDAGLYLRAFDLKEPWTTHRKYEVFEERYTAIFGRPEVTADRIVLCQLISDEISKSLPSIKNELVAKYVLTRYLLLYIVRRILENDKLGLKLISNPRTYVRDKECRKLLIGPLSRIVGDVVIDVSQEVESLGIDFDYRDKLRDQEWAKNLANTVVATHRKLVARGSIPTFQKDWEDAKATV